MKIDFTPQVERQIARIKHKQKNLYKKILKQLRLFQENPQHPSLRTHKLSGDLRDTWSISIGMDLRMIYYVRVVKGEKRAVFIAIGTHDEVYR